MRKGTQRTLCCLCGKEEILALGRCATCYTLKRQDVEYFGRHRETVLARDNYRCSVPGCTNLKRGKRSIAVHYRVPGESNPKLMLTLCLACHAKVSRTLVVQADWPALLRELWREQHPGGHEQTRFDFIKAGLYLRPTPLFDDFQSPNKTRRANRTSESKKTVA